MTKVQLTSIRTRILALLSAAALVFATQGIAWADPADGEDSVNETPATAEESAVADAPEDTDADADVDETATEPAKQGLVTEDGKTYFYNEDGTLFTQGYKVVTVDGKRAYYYFTEDGSAYTDGYLEFDVNDKTYRFFFTEDGTAFTDGYKEIELDGQVRYFYFLPNGQAFNTGYKTVMIDGKKYYFYFDDSAQAELSTLQAIELGDRTAYMLFGEDGKAYTAGYKELESEDGTDYYYFLPNGQAFTTGYKVVKIDGENYYFFFEDDGTAYTDGLKEVPFGTLSFYYLFAENGRAYTNGWQTVDDVRYYAQANGRVAFDTWVVHADGDAYCYIQSDGTLLTNAVKNGYRLDEDGKSYTKYRIIEYVNQHTNSTMTNQEKIDALYNWVYTNSMKYISYYEHIYSDWTWEEGWVDDFAISQMDEWGGNCFRYSAFFGLMVYEATGLPVEICHGTCPGATVARTPHGWVIVQQDGNWYVYDPELGKHSDFYQSVCYRVSYNYSRGYADGHYSGVGVPLY